MKFIINFFRKDIWRKLLALALAGLLYWNLSDREKVSKNFTVPMELSAAAGLFLPEDYKLDVRVTAKGTERALQNLKIKGVIKINRNDRQNGKFRIRLDERNFERRKDVEITRIEPEIVELPVQMYIQRDVRVVPKTSGKVLDGFELKALSCDPATVRIGGPENEVNAVESIETEELKLDFDRNFTQNLKLNRPQLPNIVISANETIVKVDISPVLNQRKVFENIPVRYLFPHTFSGLASMQRQMDFLPSVSRVMVVITAPPAVFEEIEPEKLYVVADLSAELLANRPGQLNVRLYCPELMRNFSSGRIREIEIHPAAVTVTVQPGNINKTGNKQNN